MEVSGGRGHWRVEVCMSVNPDDAEVRTLLGMPPHRANAQTGKGGALSISAAWGYCCESRMLSCKIPVTCGRLPAWQACIQPPQLGSRHLTASCWLHPHCEESWHPCRVCLPQWCERWGHQSHGQSSLGTNVWNQLEISCNSLSLKITPVICF